MKIRVKRTKRKPQVIPQPAEKSPLTPSEAKALTAFMELLEASPVTPSAGDIGLRIGKHVSHAARLLNRLVEKGWLLKEPNKYRSLRLAA
jgi:DNA-binding MarR family transcriptional regulator